MKSLSDQARATPQTDTAKYDQLVSEGKTKGYVTDALFGVALVGAVTGAVLLITSGSSASAPANTTSTDPTATIVPLPGGATVAVQGRF